MFNHMYGSPFPVINPKVRYKTALERAGFDTNFQGEPLFKNDQYGNRRNVSASCLQPACSKGEQSYRVNSLPGARMLKGRAIPSPRPTAPLVAPFPAKNLPGERQQNKEVLPADIRPYNSGDVSGKHNNNNGPAQAPYSPQPPQEKLSSTQNPYAVNSVSEDPYCTNSQTQNPYADASPVLALDGFTNDASTQDVNIPGSSSPLTFAETSSKRAIPLQPSQSTDFSYPSDPFSDKKTQEVSNSAFDFETSINPIQKSFMMLTQNDSSSSAPSLKSSSVSGSGSGSRSDSMHTANRSPRNGSQISAVSDLNIPVVEEEDSSVYDDEEKETESLNFEPCPELSISLTSKASSNGASGNPKSGIKQEREPLPALTITTHFTGDSASKEDLEDLNFALSNDQRRNEKTDKQPGQSESLIHKKPLHECTKVDNDQSKGEDVPFGLDETDDNANTQTATSLQVEKLLARLNDVSEHKNAQVGTFLNSSANTIADSIQSHDGTRSLSVGKSASPPESIVQFKKSSAYLSTYPMSMASQSVTIPDDQELASSKFGDTPVLYKFKQQQLNDFDERKSTEDLTNESSGKCSVIEEPKTPRRHGNSIEPLQLKIKDSTRTAKEIDGTSNDARGLQAMHSLPVASGQDEIADKELEITKRQEHPREHKHPPGEGPCRSCNQEVTGKRIYSKKDNELSGQWHRDCFRCLTCNVKFSKQTSCYILDDKPYCQQHYHEENNSICKICNGFIEGECLENDRNIRFHLNCLTCFLCKTPISSDYFIYNEELPLCSQHDIESLLNKDLSDLEGASNLSKRRTRLINFSQT